MQQQSQGHSLHFTITLSHTHALARRTHAHSATRFAHALTGRLTDTAPFCNAPHRTTPAASASLGRLKPVQSTRLAAGRPTDQPFPAAAREPSRAEPRREERWGRARAA